MNRIFSDAKDLYVETTFAYLGLDSCLYKDPEFTKPFTAEEIRDLFHKGLTVNLGSYHSTAIAMYWNPEGPTMSIKYIADSSIDTAYTVDANKVPM